MELLSFDSPAENDLYIHKGFLCVCSGQDLIPRPAWKPHTLATQPLRLRLIMIKGVSDQDQEGSVVVGMGKFCVWFVSYCVNVSMKVIV